MAVYTSVVTIDGPTFVPTDNVYYNNMMCNLDKMHQVTPIKKFTFQVIDVPTKKYKYEIELIDARKYRQDIKFLTTPADPQLTFDTPDPWKISELAFNRAIVEASIVLYNSFLITKLIKTWTIV